MTREPGRGRGKESQRAISRRVLVRKSCMRVTYPRERHGGLQGPLWYMARCDLSIDGCLRQ